MPRKKTTSTDSEAERDALKRIYRYAEDVRDGRILTGRKVRLCIERFWRDLERSKTDPDYPWKFDEKKAVRSILYMERFLMPTKGDYDKIRLIDFQCFFQGNVYGWVHKKNGLRRFRKALLLEGRGNGKSTIMAGNASYLASKDDEKGAEIYLVANSQDQAKITGNICSEQIRFSPVLDRHFRCKTDGIYYDPTASCIKWVSSVTKGKDGFNVHGAIFDEIHDYEDYGMINVVERGQNKRRQPVSLYISTMGYVLDGPLMDYYQIFTDAMTPGILDDAVADRMFAMIYELDESDPIDDPDLWIKANPGIGVLLDLNQLKDDYHDCLLVPSKLGDFVTKQLNRFADKSDATYVDISVINRNTEEIDLHTLEGMACYGGMDLSTRDDFTSCCLEFALPGGKIFWLEHTFVPETKVKMNKEKLPWKELQRKGVLTIVENEYVDQPQILEWWKEQSQKYIIQGIGYDPANAMWLVRALQSNNFYCEIVRQGPITLNDPMKDIKELLVNGKLLHNNDRLMRWYMHNVRLRNDHADLEKENWAPVKGKRFGKIDGFMAGLDAHTLYLRNGSVVPGPLQYNLTYYPMTGGK